MKQGLSKQQIFDIAKRQIFWVHKYRYCNSKLRSKIRRMCKDGVLKVVANSHAEYGVRASVTQLVECRPCNADAAGSSPA